MRTVTLAFCVFSAARSCFYFVFIAFPGQRRRRRHSVARSGRKASGDCNLRPSRSFLPASHLAAGPSAFGLLRAETHENPEFTTATRNRSFARKCKKAFARRGCPTMSRRHECAHVHTLGRFMAAPELEYPTVVSVESIGREKRKINGRAGLGPLSSFPIKSHCSHQSSRTELGIHMTIRSARSGRGGCLCA